LLREDAAILEAGKLPQLTPEVLRANGLCGFPVLEYLLWQDEPLSPRRSEFLKSCTEVLVADVEALAQEWQAGKLGNYRAMFEEAGQKSIERILLGMSLLSSVEIAGTRLQMALDTQSPSEIPSSRSGTTKADLVASVQGLRTFWKALRGAVDSGLVEGMDEEFKTSADLAAGLPEDFMAAIRDHKHAPMLQLIEALEKQAVSLRLVGRRLGVMLPVEIMSGDE
jgi:uncharacterized iron-regulated protein